MKKVGLVCLGLILFMTIIVYGTSYAIQQLTVNGTFAIFNITTGTTNIVEFEETTLNNSGGDIAPYFTSENYTDVSFAIKVPKRSNITNATFTMRPIRGYRYHPYSIQVGATYQSDKYIWAATTSQLLVFNKTSLDYVTNFSTALIDADLNDGYHSIWSYSDIVGWALEASGNEIQSVMLINESDLSLYGSLNITTGSGFRGIHIDDQYVYATTIYGTNSEVVYVFNYTENFNQVKNISINPGHGDLDFRDVELWGDDTMILCGYHFDMTSPLHPIITRWNTTTWTNTFNYSCGTTYSCSDVYVYGDLLYSIGCDDNGNVTWWNLTTNQEVDSFKSAGDKYVQVDQNYIYTSEHGFDIYDRITKSELAHLDEADTLIAWVSDQWVIIGHWFTTYEGIYIYNKTVYDRNITIDVGSDGLIEDNRTIQTWSTTYLFSNATAFNNYRLTCTEDSNGECTIPVNISLGSIGYMNISNANISYQYNITEFVLPITEVWCGSQNESKCYSIRWNSTIGISSNVTIDGWYVYNNSATKFKWDDVEKNTSAMNGNKWINLTNLFINTSADLSTFQNHTLWESTREGEVRTTPSSIVKSMKAGNVEINTLTLWHESTAQFDFNISCRGNYSACNTSLFTHSFNYTNPLNLTNETVLSIQYNITALVTTGTGTYYGNLSIMRMSDEYEENITLEITVSGLVGDVSVYPYPYAGIDSFTPTSMYSNQAQTRILEVNNTGDYNLTGCNMTSNFLQAYTTFNDSSFTVIENATATVKWRIEDPPAGTYSGSITVTCVATPTGGKDADTVTVNDFTVTQYTTPTTTPGGGGGAKAPKSENITISASKPLISVLVTATPKKKVEQFFITNDGDKQLSNAEIYVSTSLEQFVEGIEVCESDGTQCVDNLVTIAPGDSKLVNVFVSAIKPFKYTVSGEMKIESGNVVYMRLPMEVSRMFVVGNLQNWLIENVGISDSGAFWLAAFFILVPLFVFIRILLVGI